MTTNAPSDEVYGFGKRPAQKCQGCGRDENLAQPFLGGVCMDCLRNPPMRHPPPVRMQPPMPNRSHTTATSSGVLSVVFLVGFGLCTTCALLGILGAIIGPNNTSPPSPTVQAQPQPKPIIPTKPTAPVENKVGAWVMAEAFIKSGLKSPSTASFGSVWNDDYQDYEKCVTALGDNTYLVAGWVDSQNGFGATVRTDFVLKIKEEGNRWVLVDRPIMDTR